MFRWLGTPITRWLPAFWGTTPGATFTVAPAAHGGGDLSRRSARLAQETGAIVAPDNASAEALLSAIFQEYSGLIHSYAYHLLGNQEDADDVTQEVFVRAYARLDQLRDPASLRSWLYRIATNLCMDQLRRRSRIRRVFGRALSLGASDDPSESGMTADVAQPSATAALESVAERDHIIAALRRMPLKYATCLLLYSVQGLSYREIAEALELSPGAAAVRLSRARDLFAQHYEDVRKEGAS